MNILILCVYSIKNPKHGGQLRVRHIADAYRAVGHNVQVAGVLSTNDYEQDEGFLSAPTQEQLNQVCANTSLMEDYALGQLFEQDEQCIRQLASLIKIQPNIIHVEQPWLFGFAKHYATILKNRPQLIYGSQNIEWRMKRDIVAAYKGDTVAKQYAELVQSVELQAIKEANAVICVSQSDARWLANKTDRPIIIAPNGVKAWQSNATGQKMARIVSQGYRYALYCASAHPPNMTGFFELFSGGFGSLKPDEKLVFAGGASNLIAADPRLNKSAKLTERLIIAGVVSQASLEGLLDQASCIVLPITHGGGTNLKTAEALWSGKHIVATTIAMRGFELFNNAPGVFIADDPPSFKQALRRAMSAAPTSLSQDDLLTRESVLWQNCLAPLTSAIQNMCAQNL
jgi:hypothetical protein